MLIKQKKLFFNTLDIIHDERVFDQVNKRGFSKITVYAYKELNLPTKFSLARIKQTSIINLSGKNYEEVFNSFSDTVRNEINKSQRDDNFRFVQNDDKREAYKLYRQFELMQNRAPVSFDFFSQLLVFNAYYESGLISSVACFNCGRLLKIFAIFSRRLDHHNDSLYKVIGQGSKRLMFEVCKYGIDNNLFGLDLAYVNFEDPEKSGITSYKMKFGGEVVKEYRYVYKSKLFKFFESFAKFKVWAVKKYGYWKLEK